jgi:hypothetical protein
MQYPRQRRFCAYNEGTKQAILLGFVSFQIGTLLPDKGSVSKVQKGMQ